MRLKYVVSASMATVAALVMTGAALAAPGPQASGDQLREQQRLHTQEQLQQFLQNQLRYMDQLRVQQQQCSGDQLMTQDQTRDTDQLQDRSPDQLRTQQRLCAGDQLRTQDRHQLRDGTGDQMERDRVRQRSRI